MKNKKDPLPRRFHDLLVDYLMAFACAASDTGTSKAEEQAWEKANVEAREAFLAYCRRQFKKLNRQSPS